MRRSKAGAVALGGMLAALSVVIMCLGGLIPLATYLCPVLCTMLGAFVLKLFGRRIHLTWYAAVALLCLVLGPDKEAACVFLILGCYPAIKLFFDTLHLRFLWKLLYFECSILAVYGVLMSLMGATQFLSEFTELGVLGLAVLLFLGNVTFFLLDVLLKRIQGLK